MGETRAHACRMPEPSVRMRGAHASGQTKKPPARAGGRHIAIARGGTVARTRRFPVAMPDYILFQVWLSHRILSTQPVIFSFDPDSEPLPE